MTQQNETQQHGAAEPERSAPAGSELADSGEQGTAGQAGPLSQPGTFAQPGTPPKPGTFPQPATPTAAEPGAVPPARYGYESVPEAYLAPPQAGQPSYGKARRPGGGRPFGGQPGYGRPAGGQPGNGQSGYGQPAGGRPAYGSAARRDPALASPWQRLVAQTIDWIIILVVSVIVFWSQLSVVWREVQAITGRYPDLTSPAAQAAINSVSRNPANQHALVYWFLGIFGLALLYYWVQHAAWGATIGKRAMGVRVVRATDRSRIGVRAAGIRAVAFLVGPAVFLLLAYPANVLGGILWVADSGMPVLDSRAQSLHDKLAGTVVVRKRALDEQARQPSTW
jgi:uncharacterized RDD family membrane protein YckC